MEKVFPNKAEVVIVGGGVIGTSVAYHLAKVGVTDTVLLERKQLSCGTTWHAAGLVGQLRASHNLTRLARYTCELFEQLESETGQALGFKQNGSLSVAKSPARLEELKRGASMARKFGLNVEVVDVAEALKLHPALRGEDLAGAVFLPDDGQINPADVTQAYAKGARAGGVQIFENTAVSGLEVRDGAIAAVETARGTIEARYVVNCAGLWAREVGRMAGVNVPLHAAEHFYIVTEPSDRIPRDLPVLRDPDGCVYIKEDAGKLLVGAFEPVAKPWGMQGVPEDFAFDTLPEDWDHFMPMLENAMARVPVLENLGVQLFFNGPESFTPDDRYILGEAPEVRGYFVAAGFNSIGIQSSGGAGQAIAHWISEGRPPFDLWDVDIRRCLPYQANARYLHDRTVEGLGLLYAMHWPHRQFESARGMRLSALHDELASKGACFGETAGWERPNWYAPDGVKAEYVYSFGRQNWFEHSAAEHAAVRESVGLFDQSSFAKFVLRGPDALGILNRVCANDVDVTPGRVVYTQWLNERGGIEADLTVTRMDSDSFLIVTGAALQVRDYNWLARHIAADARAMISDVTSSLGVLGVMGPNARAVLEAVSPTDFSNAAFPFGCSKEVELGQGMARASRITYMGELGYELYIPTECIRAIYRDIVAAGAGFSLKHVGMHAMDSLRMEKAYRHWGHDITTDDTPLEAGLGFAVAFDKPGGFNGRDALLEQRERGLTRRLVQFALDDPEPMLYHEEPIYRDGVMIGSTTSGAYGHTLGRAVALGYVEHPDGVDAAFIESGEFEIEVACERYSAKASLRPMYDPKSARIRA